ncbi:pentapeptide repeat-containing protein [[Limnothrix rosea] IAM M-220]|uniref:pentapeptide repeat-containing protein n=1 Tax=[Limnothrix rosea] IAM M-220 TaxID=454133 RepID=UPI0009610CC2|nr:pentapeptide repeat-containing protein [[Limnothrix rosea] IAM M-220]OKH11418.1 hypothetical protein NIES208_17290 [[Limnothrix rosea] IAM M-220]
MTVTQTKITAILSRLEKIEARQNLLKNSLLSLKKQVDTLAASFQNRPELAQLQSIQTTLDHLARFGEHIDSPIAAKKASPRHSSQGSMMSGDGIDPDVLVMPLLDNDSELEDVFDNDIAPDLSMLLDTMDMGAGQGFDDLELGGSSLDGELGDRLLEGNLDLDNLDLENISLDELEQLDLYSLGNLDDDLGSGLGSSEQGSKDFGDLEIEGFDSGAGLGNGQIGKLNDTMVRLTESDALDAEQASQFFDLEDVELDPVAMNALDLADLSDLDVDDLTDTHLDGLALGNSLDDLQLPSESFAAGEPSVEMPESLENTGFEAAAIANDVRGFDFSLENSELSDADLGVASESDEQQLDDLDHGSLDDLAIASSVGEPDLNLDLNLDHLELEVAVEMDNYDNLLSPDYDEILDTDRGSAIAENLLEPPAVEPAAAIQQTLESAAQEMLDQETTDLPAADLTLEAKDAPQDRSPAEPTPDFKTQKESLTPDPDTEAIASPERPDELAEVLPEITQPTSPPLGRTPILDTESPEELATASQPPVPAPQAELTAEEIITRIENRQHYFIGFQLMQLQLAQQNLRDCVFDTSNLQNSQLQNSDLRDSSFKSCDLTAANLEYTSLERANFEQANLAKAKLQGILFNSRTSFLGANLEGADFSNLDLTRPPEFKQANLRRAQFVGVNLRGVNCQGWNFSEVNLQRANLIDTNFRDTDLTGADLTGAIYSAKTIFPEDFQPTGALLIAAGEDLSQQDLQKQDLSKLQLTNINFSGANLEHANLDKCDLSDANFSGANLRRSQIRATCLETNFENANLTQADLSEANVTGSNFSNANLEAATLKNANFTMANLRGAQLKNADTYRMNCNGANLENLDLTGINFEGDLSGANLTRAKLCGLNFNYLDLSWANLTDADVTDVTFKETNLDNANLRGAIGFNLDDYDYKIYLNNTILPDGKTLD